MPWLTSWMLARAALAQEPEPPQEAQEAPADMPEEADIEIEVIDERAALIRLETSLAVEGYHLEKRKGPWRIYEGSQSWMARLFIHDEGFMAVEKPLLREAALRLRGDWRAARNRQGQTVDAVQGEVAAWRRAQQHRIHQERMAVVTERLERLWLDGVPWEASDPHAPAAEPPLDAQALDTPAARKQALLSLYVSRADTPEGEAVKAAVRAFLIHEVWPIEPPTEEEKALLGEP